MIACLHNHMAAFYTGILARIGDGFVSLNEHIRQDA